MLNKTLLWLSGACLALGASTALAQNTCHIKGTIDNTALRFKQSKVEKVYLSTFDQYDRPIVIDSAVLVDKHFEFRREIDPKAPILMGLLTGFDNGAVSVFLEPGQVQVQLKEAAFPSSATVTGTRNNDLYEEYKAFNTRCSAVQHDYLKALAAKHGEKWLDSPQGQTERYRFGAEAVMACNADKIEFLLKHPASPLTPLMMEREISYMLDKTYGEKLLSCLSPDLREHPYYISFSNSVKAQNLKVGGELPNITLPLLEGGQDLLSKYRGKYVLLDFWASWCGPCLKELPHLKELHKEFASNDKFALISFSLDTKEADWKNAIKNKGIDLPGWVHASDLLGWGSATAKMCGVTALPKMILLDPEGKVISFVLRGEEMVRRVKQIMSGDTYYLDSGEEKE